MSRIKRKASLGATAVAVSLCATMALAGCAGTSGASSATSGTGSPSASSSVAASASGESASSSADAAASAASASAQSSATTQTIESSADGEHAITADGTHDTYANVAVVKTGDANDENADFYGDNAAIFATNGATLDLDGITVNTDGSHANGVFSYGEGTTVNVSNSVIETSGNGSGGIMTTGGGTMNAANLTIHTTGNSSAAIRSDRGGGTVTVTGGTYTAEGKGSPSIYSTADITVNDATLESTSAQGIVIEGRNSVTLNDVDLTASNVSKNSNKSPYYQAVMIYQSMSGDAKEGEAHFAMNGGTLTNKNGDVFFVNNTATTIELSGATITNEDESGVFLRAAAAGWGKEGSNGGRVKLNATNQVIDGDLLVDSISTLALNLSDGSQLTGAINPENASSDVSVTIDAGSTWTLTGDSYVTSLDNSGTIDLNGHALYVNGELYSA